MPGRETMKVKVREVWYQKSYKWYDYDRWEWRYKGGQLVVLIEFPDETRARTWVGRTFRQAFPELGRLTPSLQQAVIKTAPSEVEVERVRRWDGSTYWAVAEEDLQPWVERVRQELGPLPSRIVVDWEILPADPNHKIPPGVKKELRGKKGRASLERLQVLAELEPEAWAVGKYLGHRLYRVALFSEVAVADCDQLGNALYWVEKSRWQEVFRHTKSEARRLGAKRLIHRGDWKGRLKKLVQVGVVSPPEG